MGLLISFHLHIHPFVSLIHHFIGKTFVLQQGFVFFTQNLIIEKKPMKIHLFFLAHLLLAVFVFAETKTESLQAYCQYVHS